MVPFPLIIEGQFTAMEGLMPSLSAPVAPQGTVTTYTWHWQGQPLSIATETLGSGPPVLLLPAFSTVSTRAELAQLAQGLAAHAQVTLLDWPGFGDSDRPKLPYQPSLYHQFLQDFVRDQFTEPVAVVAAGHAAGYALALTAWSQMILVAPTWRGPLAVMGVPDSIRHGVRELVRSPLVGQLLYGLNTRPGFLKWMYQRHVFVDADQLTPDYLDQRYQGTQQPGARYAPAAFVTGSLDPMQTRADWLAALAAQSAPVTVMVAERAPRASKAEMEAMAAQPQVQVMRFPGSLGLAEEFGTAIAKTLEPQFQQTEP